MVSLAMPMRADNAVRTAPATTAASMLALMIVSPALALPAAELGNASAGPLRRVVCAGGRTNAPPQWFQCRLSRKSLPLRLQCLRHSFELTAHVAGGGPMLDFDYKDLFQWDRFITPSIIKLFYWLALGISALFALANIVSGLALMSLHPLASLFWILGSLIGLVVGVIFSRVISEYFLIMFRINEHLGAIRNQGSGIREQEAGPRL
jgi:hypothetical protein